MPTDFVAWSTADRWFAAWRDNLVFERIDHALVIAGREHAGLEARPTAAAMESWSVKTMEAGGRGYDAGKKIKSRKRHALVDIDDRELLLEPHLADVSRSQWGSRALE